MSIEFYKKLIIGLTVISLFYNPGFFISKTYAFASPDVVAALQPIAASTGATAGSTSTTVAQGMHKESNDWLTTLKQVAGQALKKLVLDRLVDAAVQWIEKGGFEGKGGPIVADWGAFFQQAGEEAIGMYAQKTLPWLCSPIKVNVALSLFSPQQQEGANVTCTLNTIVSDIDNLFKEFDKQSKGRWLTYNALWEPQNNFYGATLVAEDQKETTLADTLKSKTIDAQINAGYKSQVQCKADPQNPGHDICRTLTPGNQIAQAVWNTYTDQTKVAGILSADDVAGYIGALADAVIYRYSLLAMNGIAGALGYKDSDNKSTAYSDYQNAQFSQINSLIFKNDRTLFNQNFNNVLAVKTNTQNNIKQSIDAETTLKTTFSDLRTCDLNGAFSGEVTSQIADLTASNVLSDTIDGIIQPTIDELQAELTDVQNDIKLIQDTQAQFNAMDPADNTSEDLMTKTYNNLVSNGTMDLQAANQALTSSQTELASIQTYVNSVTQTPSSQGGYQDIIAACVGHTNSSPNP
jgi:hypothetical protein